MGRLTASAPKLNSSTVSQAEFISLWGLETPASQTGDFRPKRSLSAWDDFQPVWLQLLLELCGVWWANFTALWRLLGGWSPLVVAPTMCGQATLVQASGNSKRQSLPDVQQRLLPHGALRFRKVREMCLRARSTAEAAEVEQLGARLRKLREALGCSRLELAQHFKLDLELVVAVENGYGNLETARRLIELAATIPPANAPPV